MDGITFLTVVIKFVEDDIKITIIVVGSDLKAF